MKKKYNYTLIFRDSKVPELPTSARPIIFQTSNQNWIRAEGSWDKVNIENYEHYSIMEDWQTMSSWVDIELWRYM